MKAPASYRLVGKQVKQKLTRLVDSRENGVRCGPWLADLRTEVLYWIPFLRWVVSEYELNPTTVTAVSRGHVPAWYRGVADLYVDAPDPEPGDPTGGDSQGSEATAAIPASLLSELFAGYWSGEYPIAHVLRYTRIERLASANADALRRTLPDRYVAVGAVYGAGLPQTTANADAVRALVAQATERMPAVPLSAPGTAAWNTVEEVAGGATARAVSEQLQPKRLASALGTIAAGASAVIGAVGTDAVALGVCCGVRTLGLYSDPTTVSSAELDMLSRTARVGGSSFAGINLAHAAGLARLSVRGHG